MESLKDTKISKFRADTLQAIRKLYGLDQPGSMDDVIDILQDWIKKQDHFLKKDYDRDYLERLIVRSKGSIERSKQRLDSMCTTRTLMPTYFVNCNPKEYALQDIEDALLPKLTQDYYRVCLLRNVGQKFESDFCTTYYKRMIYSMEYELKHEYFVGVIMVLDFRQVNLVALLKVINFSEMQQIFTVMMESYGYRIKSIHMLSFSKMIDTLVVMMKQIVSAKVGSRVQVHSTLESLHKYVEKDILPEEYGGSEKSLTELHKQYLDILGSDEHMEYMKMMNAAATNEAFRQRDESNEQVLGIPGSFRALRVD